MYLVEWQAKNMQSTPMQLDFLYPAILTYDHEVKPFLKRKHRNSGELDAKFKSRLLSELDELDQKGTPLNSDDEMDDDGGEDSDYVLFHQRELGKEFLGVVSIEGFVALILNFFE